MAAVLPLLPVVLWVLACRWLDALVIAQAVGCWCAVLFGHGLCVSAGAVGTAGNRREASAVAMPGRLLCS